MPRTHGNGVHPNYFNGYFTQANYQYSTHDPGRPTTLYFQDAIGNRGRFRRAHGQGSQLIFQGRVKRVFLSPDLLNQLKALTTGGIFEDNLSGTTYGAFMNKCQAIYEELSLGGTGPHGIYAGRASLVATAGWHIFDTNEVDGHCSAGTVLFNDATIAGLWGGGGFATGYTGNWCVW